eukprot:TRINITY_DN103532_c0_g1_i1.p1 TRINITY_DN103532_c0_g1~~TRINITY_DN103532_c0_g1_i1.p1  ORF type:complete len:941 (+),score=173.59 TRINITY_DN103532_c0_g1_i1:145-2967(+)
MPELRVLVENFTGQVFCLVRTLGNNEQHAPKELLRNQALAWSCEDPFFSVAVEFITRDAEDGQFDSRPPCKRLLLAAELVPPRFTAEVRRVGSASSFGSSSGALELRSVLLGAPALADGQASDCEWKVQRSDHQVVEIQLRLFRSKRLVPRAPQGDLDIVLDVEEECKVAPRSKSSSDVPGSRMLGGEDELRRLRDYCQAVRSLTSQAERLRDDASQEPLDLRRMWNLPDAAKVDLVFAFLAVLLRRRAQALARFGVAEGGDGHAREAEKLERALDSHLERAFKSAAQTIGPRSEENWDFLDDLSIGKLKVDHLNPAELISQVREGLGRSDDTGYKEVRRPQAPKAKSRRSNERLTESEDPQIQFLPDAWFLVRDILVLFLSAAGAAFDARSRCAMLEIFDLFGMPRHLTARWEAEIGGELFDSLQCSSILESQKRDRDPWRLQHMALAVAAGGLLLGVSGGLAAPVIAPALAASASSVGTAAASAAATIGAAQTGLAVGGAISGTGAILAAMGTSAAGAAAVFGATGAGLTSWKLSTRWGDIEEFSFEPLFGSKQVEQEIIEIMDPNSLRLLDESTADKSGFLFEDAVVLSSSGKPRALRKGSKLISRETVMAGVSGQSVVRFHFQHEACQAERSLHLAIFVSGWIHKPDDVYSPWQEAARTFFPCSGHLALQWEVNKLLEMSAMFGQMLTQEVATRSAAAWLQSISATSLVAAGSLAAMTVAWPVWVLSSLASLDNAWLVCAERARLAGKCLAHALVDRQAIGQRPVTLVGHSMGARLLVYCLLELYEMEEFHVVYDVVLLGAPVSTQEEDWRKVRAVTSGRVVNGYLESDWILAFLYRYLEWGLSVAGLSAVQVPGIENYDLSGLGMEGHKDYPRHIMSILAKMCIDQRQGPEDCMTDVDTGRLAVGMKYTKATDRRCCSMDSQTVQDLLKDWLDLR